MCVSLLFSAALIHRADLVVVDAHVLSVVVLFPNGHLVVSRGHGQHVRGQRPAHVPHNRVEFMQRNRFPHGERTTTSIVQITRPNDHFTTLYLK